MEDKESKYSKYIARRDLSAVVALVKQSELSHITLVTCTLQPCCFYLNLVTRKSCNLIGRHNAGLDGSRAYWLVAMVTELISCYRALLVIGQFCLGQLFL